MEYIKIIEKEILKVGVFTIDDWVWNDNDTLVLTTKPFFEGTDDENHLEVEYHRDSHKFTFTKVYEHETMPYNLRENDKRKFIDFMFRNCGITKNNPIKQTISIDVWLDVDEDAKVGDIQDFIKKIKTNLVSPNNDLVETSYVGDGYVTSYI